MLQPVYVLIVAPHSKYNSIALYALTGCGAVFSNHMLMTQLDTPYINRKSACYVI